MKVKHKKAYMECAEVFARCSDGVRLKVGSVIVKNNRIISCGYNGLPEHIQGKLEDAEGNTRPETRHSEKNALIGLMKSNENSLGASMFCTHSCCKFCAIDIVDAGIVEFYFRTRYRTDDGLKYLTENGVEVSQI